MLSRRSFLKYSLTASAAYLATSACSRESTSSSEKSVSVRLPIPIVEAGQTPFYLAKDKGYYKEEGLAVQFELGSKELSPIKTVITGTNTFGVVGGPDTLLVAQSQGQPLKAISVIHRNSNFPVLLTLKKSGITSVKQLEGKKVGFFYGHISTDVIRNLFRKEGVSVEEVDVGFDYSQLISGKIDAQWAFRVTAGLNLPNQGIEVNMINPLDYGIKTHGYTIFTREEVIRESPELIRHFLKATSRGIESSIAQPEDALRSLITRDSKLDSDLSLQRLKLYNEVSSNSSDFPPGYMDLDMFQSTYDRLLEEKVIQQFDVSNSFTTEFLDLNNI